MIRLLLNPTIILISFLLFCNTVWADELLLKNGDRISGTFIRLEENNVFFKTPYAGELSIDWNQVDKVVSQTAMDIELKDGTTVVSKELKVESGSLTVNRAEEPIPVAQVKAINPTPIPEVKITARANVGLSQERGNTDTDNLNLDGRLVVRTTNHRYIAAGEFTQEQADSINTSKNWLALGEYDYFWTKTWFLYMRLLYENDDFADLDLRQTYGTGIGHQFFESDDLNLLVSAGPAYVNEDFIEAGDDDFAAAQWGVDYDQYFFNSFFQLFHVNTGFWSLEDSSKWVVLTRQGVRFPLYKGITATFQYNYDYNNDPSPDAEEKWDSRVLFMLGYKFKN